MKFLNTQKMQKNMLKAQNELLELKVEGQSGGGMVKIVVNGKKDPISIKIDVNIFFSFLQHLL